MRRIYGKPQAMKTARHIRAVRCLFASIIVAFVEGFATAADDAEPVVTNYDGIVAAMQASENDMFTQDNTTVRVEGGKVVEINRVYVP